VVSRNHDYCMVLPASVPAGDQTWASALALSQVGTTRGVTSRNGASVGVRTEVARRPGGTVPLAVPPPPKKARSLRSGSTLDAHTAVDRHWPREIRRGLNSVPSSTRGDSSKANPVSNAPGNASSCGSPADHAGKCTAAASFSFRVRCASIVDPSFVQPSPSRPSRAHIVMSVHSGL
jgi:hypothetical protein